MDLYYQDLEPAQMLLFFPASNFAHTRGLSYAKGWDIAAKG